MWVAFSWPYNQEAVCLQSISSRAHSHTPGSVVYLLQHSWATGLSSVIIFHLHYLFHNTRGISL